MTSSERLSRRLSAEGGRRSSQTMTPMTTMATMIRAIIPPRKKNVKSAIVVER